MIIIKTKVISGVISALVFALNINPLLSKALESGTGEYSNAASICTTTAVSYLQTTQNSNGSWRNYIQNTAEIAQIFDLCCDNNEKLETQNRALLYYENQSTFNVDFLSKELLLSSSTESWKVNYLKSFQNPDGGFGLAEGYASDIIDTKLALKALTDIGETEAMTKAATYISSLQNEDGGFGYQQGLNSNAYLTAEIADILILSIMVYTFNSYRADIYAATDRAA